MRPRYVQIEGLPGHRAKWLDRLTGAVGEGAVPGVLRGFHMPRGARAFVAIVKRRKLHGVKS